MLESKAPSQSPAGGVFFSIINLMPIRLTPAERITAFNQSISRAMVISLHFASTGEMRRWLHSKPRLGFLPENRRYSCMNWSTGVNRIGIINFMFVPSERNTWARRALPGPHRFGVPYSPVRTSTERGLNFQGAIRREKD